MVGLAATRVVVDNGAEWYEIAPQWLTAGFAAAALWLAYRAGKAAIQASEATRKILGVETARDAERQNEALSAQADLIAAWTDHRRVGGRWTWAVVIQNSSALPIWDVKLALHGPDSRLRKETNVSVVAPGETVQGWSRELLGEVVAESPDGAIAGREFRVAIEFRDAGGRTWKRSKEGTLTQTGQVIFGELRAVIPNMKVNMKGAYTPPPPDSRDEKDDSASH